MLNDKDKFRKIKKPVLVFEDEYYNETISNIFEESFRIKVDIAIEDIDLKNYSKIKVKLVDAKNKYMR